MCAETKCQRCLEWQRLDLSHTCPDCDLVANEATAMANRDNGDLYREWVAFLCKREGIKQSTADIRATAFFNAWAKEEIPAS